MAACSLPGDYATVPAELMKWVEKLFELRLELSWHFEPNFIPIAPIKDDDLGSFLVALGKTLLRSLTGLAV